MRKPKHFRVLFGVLTAFLLLGLLLAGSYLSDTGQYYQIVFFDVGQGDAAMIRTPAGRTVMIDCGTDLSADTLVAQLYAERIDEIDCLILTHAHEDHIGGAFALITRFEVKKILMGDYALEGVIGDKIGMAAACPIESVGTGYEILLGEGATITVLAPDRAEENGENNDSLILLLTIGVRRFLFTGDMETDGEIRLMERYPSGLRADVLKVGHHGSATSTSEAFLEAVQPTMAVISVGRGNSYGHPAYAVLDRLEAYGVTVLRTDQRGNICFRCDGIHIYLKE